MANKTVADLTSKIPALTDIIPVADPTTGVAGKSLVSDVVNFGLPTQSGNSGKYLTTNGTSAYWDSNPLGTVTSVGGNGTVNGLSLSGTVTSSGNITLGGTLSGVDLTNQITGILPVTNGGTGTANGSITSVGNLTFLSPSTSNGGSVSIIGQNQTPTVGVTTNGGVLSFQAGSGYDYYPSGPFQYRQRNGQFKFNEILLCEGPSSGYMTSANSTPVGHADSMFFGKFTLENIATNYPTYSLSRVTAVGHGTFRNASNVQASTALGTDTCSIGSHYYFSTAIGSYSLAEAKGNYDVGVGSATIVYKTAGDGYNVAIGQRSLTYATNLSRNTAVGQDSGSYCTSNISNLLYKSTDSIFIGYRSRPLNNDCTNEIVIGTDAIGKGSNSATLGNTNTNAAYIYGNTLNLGNGASSATITANGALTVTAGGTNQDVTLTPSGTGKVNAPAIKETVFTITDGASVDINPANGGIQVWTLGANRTPTASSFAEGQSVTLMVDDGTAYAITWSTISPTWIGGSAPTLATSGYTVIELWKRSSTIYGALVGTA
jgi:hypothetical protein